ncbi:MAG: ABC-F family ATP-binding cassette domain-containing protein [Patescibacteria group bacterium]|jgi:ATP-binding cassette subfamily F protein 3
MAEEVILRFDEVSFEYAYKKPLLEEASFSVRKGAKITLMGQNGAGKSTIFNLIQGKIKPQKGRISITNDATIGTARQTMDRDDLELTVEKYFAKAFTMVPGNLKSRISKVLEAVNLNMPLERKVGDMSGGQQARLLLAYALIQDPDILLLDEPTNNLDSDGIDHLITFLVMYEKTVIVISHDADFLNCFTEGVIYLDVFTHKIEAYVGDYYSVVEEISKRIEREQMENARAEKLIRDRKEKVNFFANKGGKMRKLAKKLRDEIEEQEDNIVDVRREDKTIRNFTIPEQNIKTEVVTIKSVLSFYNHLPLLKDVDVVLRKKTHLLVTGPNGIGKSTFLRFLVAGKAEGATITEGVRIGYYSQDFSQLNFDETVFNSLKSAILDDDITEQEMRSTAAGLLITGELMDHTVGSLSEGQKGLLSFARLVLMRPGLLVLDEPTNHINFRHIPVIAKAINDFEGAMILVSHMPDFVKQIRIDEYLDLNKV